MLLEIIFGSATLDSYPQFFSPNFKSYGTPIRQIRCISNWDMQNLVKFKGKENRLDNIRIPTTGGVLNQLVNSTNVHVLKPF